MIPQQTLRDIFKFGFEAQKFGNTIAAKKFYSEVLRLQANHSDANHNMGVLEAKSGNLKEAYIFFKKALEANSSVEQYWVSYVDVLVQLNEVGTAKDAIESAESKGLSKTFIKRLEAVLTDRQKTKAHMIPKKIVDQLLQLYDLKKLIAVSEKAKVLIKQYPGSFFLWNILGAAQKGLGLNGEASKAFKRATELDPSNAAGHNNLGVALKDELRLDEAIAAYEKAISLKFDYPSAYNNLGLAFQEKGKLKEAVEIYNKALSFDEDYADAYNNLGNALRIQGNLKGAIESYRKALHLNPDYAEAYSNMGNALSDQGKIVEALESYNKALSLKPNYAIAKNNKGVALHAQGRFQEALKVYHEALYLTPNYAEVYNNIGNALYSQGKGVEAIRAYSKAISLMPDYTEAYFNLSSALKVVVFEKSNPALQKVIVSLLDKKNCVRPIEISNAAISLLKFEPKIQKYLIASRSDMTIENLDKAISDLSELPLLLKLMSVCPLPDLELEKILRDLRARILLSISDLKITPEVVKFQSALALHCFTNEYLFQKSNREKKALSILEKSIKNSFKNQVQPNILSILCLASYKPLSQFEWTSALSLKNFPQEVLTRQVIAPLEEASLRLDLPILRKITNKGSSEVRVQYEESPYPRWVYTGLPSKPQSISNVVYNLKLKLVDHKINLVSAPKILIAGCGTGQHSMGTASRFKNSEVLAIDLSLASLSYAKQKTKEFGIKNIEYMQADILDLGELHRKFDIVESAGVLHHMDDPLMGWRILTERVKLGGLMKLGLYSELSRQDIVELRTEIKKLGIQPIGAKMKEFRELVINSDNTYHKKIINRSDFYSLSTLRDLLFHVKEHRFTIDKIQEYLNELGLRFCGFEGDKIVSDFKLTNTHIDDPYDLQKWKEYEEKNVKTFAGMYQFWCQKII